ncbi:Hypothetical predicted protein [Cloeon dipterum]|uniref:Ionotropic glutamate receptor C-terminal domain-containing protein n=1 Tax=Cloeon dipterum TaxID=197152 RepID=A0A8S1BZK7_9INSE|nr:Hypothetical predicted protein [Cloeon dipterum]
MSDAPNVTAAAFEADFLSEGFTFEFANELHNERNFPLQVWTYLAQSLRFRLQISLKTKDVIGAVAEGKAAVGFSLVPMEPGIGNSSKIAYFGPLLEKSYQLVVARDEGPQLADLRAVFGLTSWALVGLTAILFWLALMVLVRGAGDEASKRKIADPAEIAITVVGMIAYQGALAMDSSRGGRFVLFLGLIFGLLVFNAFSAGLVSQLAVGRAADPPADKQGLATRNLIVLVSSEDLLENFNRLLAKNSTSTFRVEVSQDWARVCEPRTALMLPSPPVLTRLPCETTTLPEKFFRSWWGLVVSKGPLTDKIRKSIRNARSAGLLDRWRRSTQGEQIQAREPKRSSSTRPAGMAFIAPMVAILASGFYVSSLVLVLEVSFFAIQRMLRGKKVDGTGYERTKKEQSSDGQVMPYLIIVKRK